MNNFGTKLPIFYIHSRKQKTNRSNLQFTAKFIGNFYDKRKRLPVTAKVPERLTYVEACRFTLLLQNSTSDEDLAIDFSNLKYSWPLAMLILGASIRELVRRRKDAGLKTVAVGVNNQIPAHSYLNHLGFFDFIKLPNKNKIGVALGSARYIPIRQISREQFETVDRDSKRMRDEILTYSEDLASVLAGSFDEYEVRRTMTYSFKETIRNVFEHSGAPCCFIAGQRWADGTVEVAVVDEGCGIKSSLEHTYGIANCEDAIKQAIMPGVSRTFGIEPNEHENSGFGLYVLSEVGKGFGRFALGSGDTALRLRKEKPAKVDSISFKGTFVGLRLIEAPKNFRSVLDDIVTAGEEETVKHGPKLRASKSSKEF